MRIVVLDSFSVDQEELRWDDLGQLGEVVAYPRTRRSEVVPRALSADAVLTNKVVLTASDIAALPQLRYVGIVATGTNVVDFDACRARGIAVTHAPGYCADAVAEFVFALLLQLRANVSVYAASVKANAWAESPDYCYFLGSRFGLSEKTMAIVGMGSIGKRVATIARAFGMNVVAAAVPGGTTTGRTPLQSAIESADVVTLHCPLNEKTKELVDRDFLGAMKRDALLVNTSRGGLVDEQSLLEALAEGTIGGALLDVLQDEPPARNHPLLDPEAPWASRLIVTPHIAWGTVEARRRLIRLVAENLAAFCRDERLNRVD